MQGQKTCRPVVSRVRFPPPPSRVEKEAAGSQTDPSGQAVWAASQVTCRKEGVMITMIQAHRACVAATYRSTMSRSDNPQLAALANALPES